MSSTKTNMNPKAQELLEELGFTFKDMPQGGWTMLDQRIEEAIVEALYEADCKINSLEDLSDEEATIGHAVIYVINSSLGTLADNVVKDVKTRLANAKKAHESRIIT